MGVWGPGSSDNDDVANMVCAVNASILKMISKMEPKVMVGTLLCYLRAGMSLDGKPNPCGFTMQLDLPTKLKDAAINELLGEINSPTEMQARNNAGARKLAIIEEMKYINEYYDKYSIEGRLARAARR